MTDPLFDLSGRLRVLRWLVLVLGISASTGCGLSALITSAVVLTSPDSTSSDAAPSPSVSAATPDVASHGGGETVTLTGANFPGDASVSVAGIRAPDVTILSPTELQFVVPRVDAVGLVDLEVTSASGSGVLADSFRLTNAPPSARFEPLTSPQSQNVVLSLVVSDSESDPVNLSLVVVLEGEEQPIDPEDILSGSLERLPSSADGLVQRLTWDSRASFPSQDAVGIQIRVTPRDDLDGQSGVAALSEPFDLRNNAPVSLVLEQPANDTFNVALDYRVEELDPGDELALVELTWTDLSRGISGPMTILEGPGVGPLATGPVARRFSSVWDSLSDLGLGNNRLVQVTLTLSDGTSTISATSNPFFVSNGPLGDQVVVNALQDVEGIACGDLDGDGLIDLVAAATNIVAGDDPAPGGSVAILPNFQQSFGNPSRATPPPLGDGTNPPPQAAPAGSGLKNFFLSDRPHPSECEALDVDGDGDLDLLVANSAHAPFTPGISLLSNAPSVLANAGSDAGAGFANVIAHQTVLLAPQTDGFPDVTSGTWSTSQSSTSRPAPVHAGGSTLASGGTLPLIGWFVQDLLAADLDGSGSPDDLITLHGIAQLADALGAAASPSSRPLRGAITVRKRRASGGLGPATFLDPGPMGALPAHVAVADLTGEAHLAGFPDVGGPPRTPAPGLPDVITANPGDNSISVYIQTAPSSDPDDLPGEFHGVHVPLSPLVGVLQANPSFQLPPGDLLGVATGDLNADGVDDFVVCGQSSRLALVFIHDPASAGPLSLNNNAGGPYTSLTPGLLPFRLAGVINLPGIQVGRPAISDLTGDSLPELVFPLRFGNEVAVYANLGSVPPVPALGQSRNTPLFGPAPATGEPLPPNPAPVVFASEFQPFDICADDFDADRRTDLAVGCGLSFDFSLFYQTSPGTLDRSVPVPTAGAPFLIEAGDLDGDGSPELAVTLQNANELQIFSIDDLGMLQSARRFDVDGPLGARGAPPSLVAPSSPFALRIASLNGDAIPDLLVASSLLVQGQSVSPANTPQPRDTTGGWLLVPGGDLTTADVAVVRSSTPGPIAFDVEAGDVLGDDGLLDVVLSHNQSGGLVFFRNFGGGQFAGTPDEIHTVPVGSGTQVRVADLNGDGLYPEILQATAAEATGIRVRFGAPGGAPPTLGEFTTIPTVGVGTPVAFEVVELGGPLGPNGEALPDIVFTGFTVQSAGILFQDTRPNLADPPTFTGVPLSTGGEPGQITVGDLNGDGLADIAFPWGAENRLAVYYRDPTATELDELYFGPATFETSNSPIGCAQVDLDGDGCNDIIVSARGAQALNVFLQR